MYRFSVYMLMIYIHLNKKQQVSIKTSHRALIYTHTRIAHAHFHARRRNQRNVRRDARTSSLARRQIAARSRRRHRFGFDGIVRRARADADRLDERPRRLAHLRVGRRLDARADGRHRHVTDLRTHERKNAYLSRTVASRNAATSSSPAIPR